MALVGNLTIDQGSDFTTTVYVETAENTPANLSNFTARAQARKTYGSVTAYNFNAIVSNPGAGMVSISMDSATTSSMKYGRYVYDVEVINQSSGEVTRVVEGQLEITPRVTR
jgi:uncharacterized GH25 family protein